MAELADAYGSGPYEVHFMGVRVPLSAPIKKISPCVISFLLVKRGSNPKGQSRKRSSPADWRAGSDPSRLLKAVQGGRCEAST